MPIDYRGAAFLLLAHSYKYIVFFILSTRVGEYHIIFWWESLVRDTRIIVIKPSIILRILYFKITKVAFQSKHFSDQNIIY